MDAVEAKTMEAPFKREDTDTDVEIRVKIKDENLTSLTVPGDGPSDLGLIGFAKNDDGTWSLYVERARSLPSPIRDGEIF